jgi:prepilin-type N-terminal cleavage/methylation domain-containing protein
MSRQRRFSSRNWRPASAAPGFTLIELLTVIAIIGILATLLLSSLARVRVKSQETVCAGNLRQIGLGIELYQDETGRRPRSFTRLSTKPSWLGNTNIFFCPTDKTPQKLSSNGNSNGKTNSYPLGWGNLVNSQQEPLWAKSGVAPDEGSWDAELKETAETIGFSYLHCLFWQHDAWAALAAIPGNQGGMVACELHGVQAHPHPTWSQSTFRDYEGRSFRVQRDAAVVRRRIVRSQQVATGGDTLMAPAQDNEDYPWEFYADSVPPHKIR